MVFTNSVPVWRTVNVDDETTGGKDLIQTIDGRLWKETAYTEKTAPTGVTIAYTDGKKIWW